MVYGIISAKDNQTSLAYFKSKKVSQGNLATADRLQELHRKKQLLELGLSDLEYKYRILVSK